MQRISFGFLFLAALYVSPDTNATPDQEVATSPIAQTSVTTTTPVTAPVLPALVADNPAPHIALLLPLKTKSPTLKRYAEMVQQGFLAAATVQQGLPVRVYASSDEAREIITSYRQAKLNGAIAAAGPLTRDGTGALANYAGVTIPTLALNSFDTSVDQHTLYSFGLLAEQEARQIALIASAAELRYATIISANTAVSKRLAAAFAEAWRRQGGKVTADVVFKDDFNVLTKLPVEPWPNGKKPKHPPLLSATGEKIIPDRPLPDLIAPGNMVFLAVDHEKARLLRTYLNPNLPVYGTSQLFTGNNDKLANFDLNEIHFVDMPWLLQPDHSAVMIYPRQSPAPEPDLDRLYALGIDAYRLVYILLTNKIASALPLDGVTGKINLRNQQFTREAMPAFFKQGLGLTSETLAALNEAKAAAKAAKEAEAEGGAPSPNK
jgi:hypothetical protein